MGVSTDAILFYGYCWEDEGEETELPEETWELWGKEEPVLVGRHCSDSYSVPYIYAQPSEVTAWRGYPKTINIGTLQVSPEWDDQLRSFCERFEITPPQEKPQWWLVSWWG